jgi:hypothetical protein
MTWIADLESKFLNQKFAAKDENSIDEKESPKTQIEKSTFQMPQFSSTPEDGKHFL